MTDEKLINTTPCTVTVTRTQQHCRLALFIGQSNFTCIAQHNKWHNILVFAVCSLPYATWNVWNFTQVKFTVMIIVTQSYLH